MRHEMFDKIIGLAVTAATQPFVDAVDILDGLTEGELREKAALRLGADVAMSMGAAALIDWWLENN